MTLLILIVFKTRQKDLRFNVNIDENLPDELFGDELRVRQVVVNVLNNAVKYTSSELKILASE